jgi:MOSC domain-containing protein YiiM
MEQVDIASVTITEGIVGDCRGKGGLTGNRQITIVSLEQWQEACSEICRTLPFHERRANLCIHGHSFGPDDVGKEIEFENGVILKVTGETKPCSRMDKAHEGLRKALESNWRGGVTCCVIRGGTIKVNEFILNI